jgi:hypothetical protein
MAGEGRRPSVRQEILAEALPRQRLLRRATQVGPQVHVQAGAQRLGHTTAGSRRNCCGAAAGCPPSNTSPRHVPGSPLAAATPPGPTSHVRSIEYRQNK